MVSVSWKGGPPRRPAAERNAGWTWPIRSKTAERCWSPAPARRPRSVLAEHDIQVIMMEGLIEEGLDAVYRGVPLRAPFAHSIAAAAAALETDSVAPNVANQ